MIVSILNVVSLLFLFFYFKDRAEYDGIRYAVNFSCFINGCVIYLLGTPVGGFKTPNTTIHFK